MIDTNKSLSQEWGGLLVRDVWEAAPHQPPVPGVHGRPHAVAPLVAQLLLALHPVHHVEVAHLVLGRGPHPGDPVPVADHGAARR